MDIIVQCAKVNEVSDFSLIAEGSLRDVMPHEMMICGIGGVSKQGNFVRKFLSFDCPIEAYEYYEAMLNSDGRVNSPLMQKWRDTQEPVYFQSGRDEATFPEDWVTVFNRYNMRNTIGHGVLDLTGTFSSYFIFCRLPGEVGPEQAFLLKLLTPHLHLALTRAISSVEEFHGVTGKATLKKPLSDRQQDILYWLHEGKTNWEIAKILNLSELNVKYHIDQIFVKLDVRSRVHAVAKAHELNLIRPPRAEAE
ncbi:MAG: hypothetical protein HYS18_14275 [Burkholderiales bacterium]|nr:hypothetical protein [Burkholderiales bacterium]